MEHSRQSNSVEPRPPVFFLLILQVILTQQRLLERELTGFGVRLTWVTILALGLRNRERGQITNPL